MAELIKISEIKDDTRIGDVVYVHGLNGNPREYWQSDKGNPATFWPAWLAADLPTVDVWSLGYDAAPSAWLGGAMPLPFRADNALDRLKNKGLGRRPLVFIAHSMGGLVVKQMLHNALASAGREWRPIAEKTAGVCFIATPHTGAAVSGWLHYLRAVLGEHFKALGRPTPAIEDLKAHSPALMELNTWFRHHAHESQLRAKVYRENLPWKGSLIVLPDEADPELLGVKAISLDEDHISICQPRSRESQLYEGTLAFVRDCLGPR
jgi:pimeloyl-ACP methyl ester carboxylesterase